MVKFYFTNNPSETRKLGEKFALRFRLKQAKNSVKLQKEKALVLGLEGDLGGGKTTFLQGFAKGLGIKEKILSPTFVIMKRFKIKELRFKFQEFYHIDCYRIERPKEILDLGFKKITSRPKNIVVVEWADKIRKILPKDTIWVKFEFFGKNKRKIMIR